jgi:hypothetical protein
VTAFALHHKETDVTTMLVRPAATKKIPMTSLRRTALVAGVLYLITIIASIPALLLHRGVLDSPEFIDGFGSDSRLLWAGYLDLIAALACIGTAIALYSMLRRQNEAVALGFVAARVLEATVIVIGVVSLLSALTLRQDLAGSAGEDAVSLATTIQALVAIHDWTFLVGPGLIPGINALLLGYLLYRSRLVPRVIPTLGLLGAPLLLASGTATFFGIYPQVSGWAALAALPVGLWELSLGVWLVVKGFKPSPLTALSSG